MLENFSTAFIVYFVVINPISNSPIFLAITAHLSKRQKYEPLSRSVSWRRRSCYFSRFAAHVFCIIWPSHSALLK
jgi:small neutral amino acid transporter SnatA (MarC family)